MLGRILADWPGPRNCPENILRLCKGSPGQTLPGRALIMRIDISGPAGGEDQSGSVSKYRYKSNGEMKMQSSENISR